MKVLWNLIIVKDNEIGVNLLSILIRESLLSLPPMKAGTTLNLSVFIRADLLLNLLSPL